uniref:Sulfhydryl oxidase n=1 Tax=Plectus sambesii TaxID=2011161 RepID=A0A914XBT9_9BILA
MADSYSTSGHSEGAKPCRSCFKFQEWMDMQRGGTKKDKSPKKVEATMEKSGTEAATSSQVDDHKDCPLDKDALGRGTWGLLHTMAAAYPEKPTENDRKGVVSFMNLLSNMYPCEYCAKDLRQDLAKDPPDTKNHSAFSLWMCKLHNRVNEKLGKPTFDCSKVDERWRDGPKDGSCG